MDNSERIREYISKNPGTTEHKVAEYMAENHYCARDTTHNLIYDTLIPNGKVIDKKIGNSRHKLYINDEDEFNIISQQLSGIENLIQSMDGPMRKFTMLSLMEPPGALRYFGFGYQAQIHRILTILLIRTSELELEEKESQVLYTRIVKLLVKLEMQTWRPKSLTQIFKHFHYESIDKPTPELKKMGIDDKLVDNLVTVIENFKKWASTLNLT